jgi:tripartite-type tricarboxylate transporter receptor subunit TctC
MGKGKTLIVFLTGFLILKAQHLIAQPQFYEGKTITIVNATELGGTMDMRVKSIFPFLRQYIPGQPNITVEYMPGGGGRKGANYIYRVARPDGLTIGAIPGGFVMLAVVGETGVEYDLEKLIYLGSPDGIAHYPFFTTKEAKLRGLERLRAASGIRIGAQSVGRSMWSVGCSLTSWALKIQSSLPAIQVPRSI